MNTNEHGFYCLNGKIAEKRGKLCFHLNVKKRFWTF